MCSDLSRTPRSVLVCERSSFLDERNRISSQVERLRFNYKVSVLLPEGGPDSSHLDTIFNTFSSFYLIKNLPVCELLEEDFLNKAVFQGGVYGLSFRTRIDEENCVALTPNGRLVLSLDRDSFQVLGLEGRPSRFTHRTCSRYVVEVDLMDRSMAPGGRAYLRLLKALRCHLNLRTDFLISHHAGTAAALQPLLSRYDWSERRPEVCRRALRDLLCPDLRSCDPHSLLEWLGAVDAGCGNSSSTFLSSLVCPEPQRSLSGALSVSLCGLLRPQDVWRLVEQLRAHLQQAEEDSWASVTVHGFTDSPVSWGEEEHGVLTGGETFYNLLMFQDHAYRLHLATGPQDACPP